MESEKQGEPLPPLDSPFPVSLTDIAAFLHDDIDETKLDDLLWGLSLVECGKERDIPNSSLEMSVPRAYAILKLTLLPGHLEWVRSQGGDAVLRLNRPNAGNAPVGTVVKSEPAIPAKLRAGNVQGAYEIAARRLRSSGLEPLRGFLPEMNYHEVDATFGGVAAQRLLGALLFPIPNYAVPQLADLVLRRPELETLV
jgi:CRISPR-associated protein Csx17